MMKVPFSTIFRSLAVGILAGAALGGMIGAGATDWSRSRFARTSNSGPDEEAVRQIVRLAYVNEHLNPQSEGKCWLPGSPAQMQLTDHVSEIRSLIPVAQKHLSSGPNITSIRVNDDYATVTTTERWYVPKIGTAQDFLRTYYLKKDEGQWQVYQLTPLPLSRLVRPRA